MRVNSGGGAQSPRMLLGQFDRRARTRNVRAGDDHVFDARLAGAMQHRIAIVVKAVVREIQTNVDQ